MSQFFCDVHHRAWEKPSMLRAPAGLTQGRCEARESMAAPSAVWEFLSLPLPFCLSLVFVASLEKRHGGCSGAALGGHAAITALQGKICLLFVVPCQCKAEYEKTARSALLLQPVVRISAWAGETRGDGKPGRVVSGFLVGKVEEDEGVWCSPRLSVNQLCLAKMVNHFSKVLVDPGWWTGGWHSKRSRVVPAWMLCSCSTNCIPRNFFFSSLTSLLRKCFSPSCTERWEWEWTWLGVHILKKE